MTEATKTNNGIWWLLLAIILEIPAMIVALIVVALVVIKSGIEDSPVTAAIVIPIAFIVGTLPVWYIFHRNFVKTYAPRRSGLYFGILMLIPLLASGGLIGAAYATKGANQKAEAAQEAQNMKVGVWIERQGRSWRPCQPRTPFSMNQTRGWIWATFWSRSNWPSRKGSQTPGRG